MISKAAVAVKAGNPLEIVDVNIGGPRAGEVLVEIMATGICHTDEFTLSGADPEGIFPAILGHEGAGIVREVGAGVNRTLLKDLGTAIEKLNKEKGYTFCMIEHDMDFIGRLCDPVIVMAEGSVLFKGSVEEAKKDEKVIESYLGRGSKLKLEDN